jgi:hypothetical protein
MATTAARRYTLPLMFLAGVAIAGPDSLLGSAATQDCVERSGFPGRLTRGASDDWLLPVPCGARVMAEVQRIGNPSGQLSALGDPCLRRRRVAGQWPW